MLNLSQVYVIYSNVFVVDRADTSEYASLILKGPYKQVSWLVLTSPSKPIYVISNNTEQHFIELSYDPKTMPTNPIANTTYQYAWDYDPDDQVIFTKLLLTSAVKVTIYYVVPSAPKWIIWILITVFLVVISIIAFNRYKKTKES